MLSDNKLTEIMTLDELAYYLKLPKSTIYKLVHQGRIPAHKIGRQWRFKRTIIDCWLGQNKEVA